MRHDVQKVMSERPKGSRTWVSKTPRHKHAMLDLEGERLDVSLDEIRRNRQKSRNYRQNILERFLLNRVGRLWNKVFAEVCAVADSRSIHGSVVREYLKTFVAIDCWLDGRKV